MAKNLLEHPRVLGFKLQLLVQEFFPFDKRLYPLYELVIERKKRMLFHVGNGPFGNPYLGVEHFKKLMKRYPELSANVAHMGCFEYKEFLELLDEYPNLYLDTSFSFSHQAPCMFDLGGEYLERYKDRIVYGSDFPGIFYPRQEEIECLLSFNLSQVFYDKVFWENGLFLVGASSAING
jgi:predicted TIM-barrel fold metal-dependent hydrolase